MAPDMVAAVEDLLDEADVVVGDRTEGGCCDVALRTRRGTIELRHYDAGRAERGVAWLGGVGGGFDSPAGDLYPRAAAALVAERTASVRVRFRHPGNLEQSVVDCLAGLSYLRRQGAATTAAVGHSFGGAVIVRAAAADESVRTVVTLATQAYGADAVGLLGDRCSLLALHGAADEVLPDGCSRHVAGAHAGRNRLVIYDGAGHGLEEVADEVGELVLGWLVDELLGPIAS